MYFDSFSEFIDMGGHGLYVWLAYSVFTAVIVWNLIQTSVHRRQSIAAVQRAKMIASRQMKSKGGEHEGD